VRITLGKMQEMVKDYLEAEQRWILVKRDLQALTANERRRWAEMRDKQRALNQLLTLEDPQVVAIDPSYLGAITVAIVENADPINGPRVTVKDVINPTKE